LIQWPWEKDEEILKKDEEVVKQSEVERMTFSDRVRHPIKYVQEKKKERQLRKEEAKARVAREAARNAARDTEELDAIREDHRKVQSGETPFTAKSMPLDKRQDYDDDTGRNKVDPTDTTFRNFYPTLVYPPHPNEIVEELAPYIREQGWKDDKEDSSTRDRIQKERIERMTQEKERKRKALDTMKTPLQLRWEVQRAEKLAEKKVDTDQLLAVLGKHMESNGISLDRPKKGKKARSLEVASDVD
jgi:large subunit ribosomal protein L24